MAFRDEDIVDDGVDLSMFMSDDEILEVSEGDFDNVVDEKFFNNEEQPPEYTKEEEDFNTSF